MSPTVGQLVALKNLSKNWELTIYAHQKKDSERITLSTGSYTSLLQNTSTNDEFYYNISILRHMTGAQLSMISFLNFFLNK